MLTNCRYSNRVINRLKELDQDTQIDYELIGKSIYRAKKYHENQTRRSGEPYYTHPLEVAYMVSEYKPKTDIIVTAILHDIVEDTEVTFGMILDNFNERIMQMVDRLTRDRPDGTKWSVKGILSNADRHNDEDVTLIKLVDRLHNLQTIKVMPSQKGKKIILDTIEMVVPFTMHYL